MRRTVMLRTYKEDGYGLVVTDYNLEKINPEEFKIIISSCDNFEYVNEYVH